MSNKQDRLNELAEELQGPLQHEARMGYADEAVFGGLGAYISSRAEEAAELVGDKDLAERLRGVALSFEHYAANDTNQREVLCTEAAAVMQQLRQHAGQPPPDTADARPDQQVPEGEPISWYDDTSELKGVGPARSEALAEAAIHTVGDLLRYYPYRYKDYRNIAGAEDLTDGQTACLTVTVTGTGSNLFRGRLKMTRVPAEDDGTEVTLIWFNQPYRVDQFEKGEDLFVAGKARVNKGGLSFVVQECERIHDENGAEIMGRLVPVYSDIDGVSERQLRKLIDQALRRCSDIPDTLVPPELQVKHNLMGLPDALRHMHFPTGHSEQKEAQRRLNYQELLVMQLELARRRRRIKQAPCGETMEVPDTLAEEFRLNLPFELTGAQERVMGQITDDLTSPSPAHRLVHGDVGSGKTVLAAWALLGAVRSGRQAAMMAPTELLAHQHRRKLGSLLQPHDIQPELLTGSLTEAEKSDIHGRLAGGEIPLVVGTHALFQSGVEFDDLGLVIIDEQHRFGVRQRSRLADKGLRPDVIVMSATPIPRTLALTLYGDFDISVVDELPPGRRPVKTTVVDDDEREAAYRLLVETVAEGHQAYVVCPLVDENSDLAAES
ncbi:MAG: ATP-dependent DNA helicase RecG, partial [Armatimonadota bacterium]